MALNTALKTANSIIWVLVADGGHANIYRYQRNKAVERMRDSRRLPYDEKMHSHALTPVPDMQLNAELLHDFQVGHDSRGAKIGGTPPGHNTSEPHLNIHDEVKQNLILHLAAKLNQAFTIKSFDYLIIAAPAKIMGALRQHCGAAVMGSVIAEVDKDFTKEGNHALLVHLQTTLEHVHLA